MTKKAVVSIDLAAMAGTLKFVPGPHLPRHDKMLLEQSIATTFLTCLSQHDGSAVADVQSNSNDPPDVTFTYNGELRGMELCEMLPVNRLEKDAIIRRLRRDVISRLRLSENTRGFVITIFLADDYSTRLRPGRIDLALADSLTAFFDQGDPRTTIIEVPPQLQDVVTRISVFREYMTGDPRLEDDREPLIVFGAQNTMIVPEDDCREMAESRLSRKGLHGSAQPTWLLLWSNHQSLASLRNDLDNAIGSCFRSRQMNYERVFHLHLFPQGGATEFPNSKPANGAEIG